MSKDIEEFLLTYMITISILIFMGIILPYILEYILYNLSNNFIDYQNSILVSKSIDKQRQLLYNYIYIFKLFINF